MYVCTNDFIVCTVCVIETDTIWLLKESRALMCVPSANALKIMYSN